MTKLRYPLTYDLALTRVAGALGWPRVAAILHVAERTARDWSEPDTEPGVADRLTPANMEQLDIEYQQAGGQGTPFLECYAARLKSRLADALGTAEAISAAAARFAKEHGEAIAATIDAARPNAGDADFASAERELEEAINAGTVTLSAIRNRREAERDLRTGEVTS